MIFLKQNPNLKSISEILGSMEEEAVSSDFITEATYCSQPLSVWWRVVCSASTGKGTGVMS